MQTTLQFGDGITNGLGAGADPNVGRQAAVEDRERIRAVVKGSDMILSPPVWEGARGPVLLPLLQR